MGWCPFVVAAVVDRFYNFSRRALGFIDFFPVWWIVFFFSLSMLFQLFFSSPLAVRGGNLKNHQNGKKKLKPRHANFISPLYEFLGTKLFANEKSLRCREWRNFIVEGNSSKFLLNWNSSELLQKMFSAATDSLTKATRLRTRPETVRMKRLNYANLRQNDEAITAGNRETNIKISARLCVNIIISIRAREQFCK